jgi:class 3 adenylate cyclase
MSLQDPRSRASNSAEARETALREILAVIAFSREDDVPVFDAILKNASLLCRAPIAFLSLADESRSQVVIPAHRGTRPDFGRILDEFREPFSRTELVAVRPVVDGKVIRKDDIADDDLYRRGDPRRRQMVDVEGARSVLSVPLMRADEPIGAIILYRREVAPFSDDDQSLVEGFAAQAVIAIENVRQFRALAARTAEVQALNASLETRVAEQVAQIERMERLKRFLSPAVADAVISTGDDSLLSSHRALIAVLFADIRGFTAFCETAEPEETIDVLQTYHEAMGELLACHQVGVEHRSGDGIMAIFNDPLPCDQPAGDAVRLAIAMRERMESLCAGWKRLGHRLGFGVGISLGYATVGLVGSKGRYDYTASGTTVNMASRLCAEAADKQILLSPRARAAVDGKFETAAHGSIAFKGIQSPVEVHCVIGQRQY